VTRDLQLACASARELAPTSLLTITAATHDPAAARRSLTPRLPCCCRHPALAGDPTQAVPLARSETGHPSPHVVTPSMLLFTFPQVV